MALACLLGMHQPLLGLHALVSGYDSQQAMHKLHVRQRLTAQSE